MALGILLVLLGFTHFDVSEARHRDSCSEECLQKVVLQKPDGQFVVIQGPMTVPLVQVIDLLSKNISNRYVTFKVNHNDFYVPKDVRPKLAHILEKYSFVEEVIEAILTRHVLEEGKKATEPEQTTWSAPSERPEYSSTPAVTRRISPSTTGMPEVPEFQSGVPSIEEIEIAPTEWENIVRSSTTPSSAPVHWTTENIETVAPEIIQERPADEMPHVVQNTLDTVVQNPDSFVTAYEVLKSQGVKFPEDFSKPIRFVIVRGVKYRLPKPIVPKIPIDVNGNIFDLSVDVNRFLHFVVTKQPEMDTVMTAIKQIRGKPIIKNGKLVSVVILGKTYRLQHPVPIVVVVHGVRYTLPKDLDIVMTKVSHDPQVFYKILALLEFYGFHIRKNPQGNIISVVFENKVYPVKSVTPITVTLRKKVYTIPTDLEEILSNPDRKLTGELLLELQDKGIQLNVDEKTSTINGILMQGVLVPFPIFINLQVYIDKRKFRIPADIPKLVKVLERKTLPAELVAYIYEITGMKPVLSPDNEVIGLKFNGKTYHLKPKQKTVLVIHQFRYVLPRDNDKLADDLVSKRLEAGLFLRKLQEAGYTILFNTNGKVSSVLKGMDILYLPVEIELIIILNKVKYSIPKDLERMAHFIATLKNQKHVDYVLEKLQELGVRVKRQPSTGKLVLLFNQREIPVGVTENASMTINIRGAPFRLPEQLDDFLLYSRVHHIRPDKVVEILAQNDIQVERSTSNQITGVIIHGTVYHTSTSDVTETVEMAVTIDNHKFVFPRDVQKFVNFANSRGIPLTSLVPKLEKKGISVELGPDNEVIFITVGGQRFPVNQPRTDSPDKADLKDMVRNVPEEPWVINDILTKVFKIKKNKPSTKVDIKKRPDGSIESVTIDGQVIRVPHVPSVKEVIAGKDYVLPQDLRVIFTRIGQKPSIAAELVIKLQKSNVQLITSDDDVIVAVIIRGKRYTLPGTITLFIRAGKNKVYPVPSGIPSFIQDFLIAQGPSVKLNEIITIIKGAGIIPHVEHDHIVELLFNGKRYPVSNQASSKASLTVHVKGQTFVLPRDSNKYTQLQKQKRVTFGDLVLAVHDAGATVVTDKDGWISGFRLNGKVGDLGIIFKYSIVFRGKQYVIPKELKQLADGLSTASVDWKGTGKFLRGFGLTVTEQGSTIQIGFEGTYFTVRRSLPNMTITLPRGTYKLPGDIYKLVSDNLGRWNAFEKEMKQLHVKIEIDQQSKTPTRLIVNGVTYDIPPESGATMRADSSEEQTWVLH